MAFFEQLGELCIDLPISNNTSFWKGAKHDCETIIVSKRLGHSGFDDSTGGGSHLILDSLETF